MGMIDGKNLDIEKIAKKAILDKVFIVKLLKGIRSKDSTIRETSFNVVNYMSEHKPNSIYSEFNSFVQLLHSPNTYHQYIAINILANLACADPENKFKPVFEEYFGLFSIGKTIVPAQLAKNSGKIAKVRTDLRTQITEKLLKIDSIHHGKQKELIKSYIIESFDKYFKEAEQKEQIFKFVKSQLHSKSPKTKKAAKTFLKKWEKTTFIASNI